MYVYWIEIDAIDSIRWIWESGEIDIYGSNFKTDDSGAKNCTIQCSAALGAGPVLADDGKQNPEAAEEMMVAKIRFELEWSGGVDSRLPERRKNTRARYDSWKF